MRDHDLLLVERERPAQDGAPEDHAPGGPEAHRLGVRRSCLAAHVLHLDRDFLEAELLLVGVRRRLERRPAERLLSRDQVREEEREEGRQRDECRPARQPPPVADDLGDPDHDEDRETDEEELRAEAEPAVDDPLLVRGQRDVVAALPPELDEAERELEEPDQPEAEHGEEHPGPDRAGGGLTHELRADPRIDGDHGDDDDLRQDEVPADEALVALGLREGRGREERGLLDIRQLEAVRDDALPEEVSRDEPPGDCRRERDADPDAPGYVNAGSGSGSSSGGGGAGRGGENSHGPLYG